MFFKSLVYYNYIYTQETLDMEHVIWEGVLSGSRGKTAYDVLADSLVKRNLLHPWSLVAGRRLSVDSGRAGLRTLLMQAISRACKDGWRSIVLSSSWLTPEDGDRAHVYASYLLHKVHSMAWLYPDNVTYTTVRDDVTCGRVPDVQLLPKNTMSEEEAVSAVRAMNHPSHHLQRPSERITYMDIPPGYLGHSNSSLCRRLGGCQGYSLINTSLTEVIDCCMYTVDIIPPRGVIAHLFTFGDTQGATYTYLYHYLYGLSQGKIHGHPHWELSDDDIEMTLNEGPECIALDKCKISYDKLRFQGNITGRRNYTPQDGRCVYVHVETLPQDEYIVWMKHYKTGSVIITPRDTRNHPPLPGTIATVRPVSRTGYYMVWDVGRVGESSLTSPPIELGHPICVGFCSPKAALMYSRIAVDSIEECYGVLAWLQTHISTEEVSPIGVEGGVNEEYMRAHTAYHASHADLSDTDSCITSLTSILKAMIYWSWVYTCGCEGPEFMYVRTWSTAAYT